MTTPQIKSAPAEISAASPVVPSSKTDRKKGAQERFMLMLTAAFFIGVAMDMMLPAEGAIRGIGMGVYSCTVMWLIFKFAL